MTKPIVAMTVTDRDNANTLMKALMAYTVTLDKVKPTDDAEAERLKAERGRVQNLYAEAFIVHANLSDDAPPSPEGKPPRYGVHTHKGVGGAARHRVLDHVMQIEVFHWYGDNGAEKATAVAGALNALGHEKD